MAAFHQIPGLCEQVLGLQGGERLVREGGPLDIIGTVHHPPTQGSVARLHVELVVGALLEHVILERGKNVLVADRIADQVFQLGNGLGNVLRKAADAEGRRVGTDADGEVAGEGVHLGSDFLGRLLIGTQILDIIRGKREGGIIRRPPVEAVSDGGNLILDILFI